MCQQAMLVVDRTNPVPLFECGIIGVASKKTMKVKADPVSLSLVRVNLRQDKKEVRLTDFSPRAKGDSIAEHLAVMKQMRCIPLDPAFADILYHNPGLYPEEWKGSAGQRIYVGFPGVEVFVEGSIEPMIVVLWWAAGRVNRSYAARAGETGQSKFMMAIFEGNPFAAK